jgi:hypothetical protein
MATINVLSGSLKVSGTFAASGYSYFASGYTNQAFTPGSLSYTYLNSNNSVGKGAFTTGIKARYVIGNQGLVDRHIRTQKWQLLTGNSTDSYFPTNKFNYNTLEAFIPYTSGVGPEYLKAANYVYDIDERFRHIESSGVFALDSNQKVGIGTFEPSEKVHVNGNIRVAGIINPISDNYILNMSGSYFPPLIRNFALSGAKITYVNGNYSPRNNGSNFINTNGAFVDFGTGYWYARSGSTQLYRSEDFVTWSDFGGGLPVPTGTITYTI